MYEITYFVTDVNKQLSIIFNLVEKGTFNVIVMHHYNIIEEKKSIEMNKL